MDRQESIAEACGVKLEAQAQSRREQNFYERQRLELSTADGPESPKDLDTSLDLQVSLPLGGSNLPEDAAALGKKQTYEEYQAQRNRQLNHNRFGIVVRECWDGHRIKIEANGTVRLFISSSRAALILRASNSAAKRIREGGNQATIHFASDEVTLAVDGKAVYRKSAAAGRHSSQLT